MNNARPFFDTLRDIRHGQLLEECADELQNVIAAVTETNKPGKLLIEITVAPASRGQGAVKVADKIIAKLPALPSGETIMFVTPDNNLVANDPRQKTLELRGVETKSEEPLRNVG